MRQINLESYPMRIINEQGVARFKEEKCSQCGSDLVDADPVNPKAQAPGTLTGECPKCGQVQPVGIPDCLNSLYDIKDSLIEILLSRQNQIGGAELLERDEIARKILKCPDGYILLEEVEWEKLSKAVNTVTGLGRPDVELVHRILDAKSVEVEEKKQKEG